MNIFIKELKDHTKPLIYWCIGSVCMIWVSMIKYTAAASSGQSLNELMAKMPKAVQSMVGFGAFDFSKASGYYAMLFLYIAMMAGIHAATLGSDVICEEERDKTTEFLLSKPVSRNVIISSKLLVGFINIIVFNLVTLVSSIYIVGQYGHGESISHEIVVLMSGMFFLQLIFFSIGTGIAGISQNPKTPSLVTMAILLSTFILSLAIDIEDKLASLKWLTPFKYFDAKNLIADGKVDPVYIALSLIICTIMIASTYIFYKKRDLDI